MAITWTKNWSGSDDGAILRGIDLRNIQQDIDTHLGGSGVGGYVTIAGTQTITGDKTFSSVLTCSSAVSCAAAVSLNAGDPTLDAHAARKKYVDDKFAAVTSYAYTAGDYVLATSAAEETKTGAGYTKIKEFLCGGAGTFRITFDLRTLDVGQTAYGRIYRNGVAVGTERTTTSSTDVNFSEDISGWSVGDLCQLYIQSSSSNTAGASDFSVKCALGYFTFVEV